MSDFYLLGNSSCSQMFGCVIKVKEKTIVIDGGTCADSRQMANFLKKECNSHVDAWFFTHPHIDHIGCFVDIRKNEPSITVNKIYYNFPDLNNETYVNLMKVDVEDFLREDMKTWTIRECIHRVEAEESYDFDGVKIRVLRVFEPSILADFVNNSSTVYRIEGEKKSILILGDLGVEGGDDTISKCPLELLQADYTQMAHHGQDGVTKEFYDYIKPKRCIWTAPDWLWDNDQGKGIDTAGFQTVRTREWMEALGVTEHLIEKDGIQKIEI